MIMLILLSMTKMQKKNKIKTLNALQLKVQIKTDTMVHQQSKILTNRILTMITTVMPRRDCHDGFSSPPRGQPTVEEKVNFTGDGIAKSKDSSQQPVVVVRGPSEAVSKQMSGFAHSHWCSDTGLSQQLSSVALVSQQFIDDVDVRQIPSQLQLLEIQLVEESLNRNITIPVEPTYPNHLRKLLWTL